MKSLRSYVWLGGLVALVFIMPSTSIGQSHATPHNETGVLQSGSKTPPISAKSRALSDFGKLPLSFEPNVGQTDSIASFLARGDGYELFLTNQDAVLTLGEPSQLGSFPSKRDRIQRALPRSAPSSSSLSATVLRMSLEGASLSPQISGLDELPGKNNYFLGNDPTHWHTGVPSYARVEYRDVYPGIDLVFYGNQRRLEYDLIVSPGADPNRIALHIDGTSEMRIDRDGNLHLAVNGGEAELRKPIVYQEGNSNRREISGGYTLTSDHDVRFEVGAYDHSKPLILDPALDYSTYLGGSLSDFGGGIAVDSNGNAYVGGQTMSTDFPTTANGLQPTAPSGISKSGAFITEINSSGTAALYSTYIGGNKGEAVYDIKLDSANPPNVYVTGWTCSTNFPTTSNAYLQTFTPVCTPNATGVFVTKFNPSVSGLAALEYSTYLGGNGGEIGDSLAVDSAGNIYATGNTYSTNFPTTLNAFQLTNKSATLGNVYITRLDPSKSGAASLIYSTYFGGTGNTSAGNGDYGFEIAVDSTSNVYVTGNTGSANLPTTASALMPTAPSGVSNGRGTGFLARLDTTASGEQSLVYSTFLGGSGSTSCGGDEGVGVALGPGNKAYVTGYTCSSDFPVTTGAYQPTAPPSISTAFKVFASVIDTTQSGTASLNYSTFLGGNNLDFANAITVDSTGNAYIAGLTKSSTFPTTTGAYQTALTGCGNSFVSELMPLGNGSADLVYSTYFDGTEPSSACYGFNMGAFDIALDSTNNAYITGVTEATNFPVSPSNAFQTSLKVAPDAYVAKLSLTPKVLPTPSIASLSVTSGGTGAPVTISGTNFGMNQGASTVTFGSVTATVVSWSSTSILVEVPIEGTAGSVNVVVHTAVAASNSKSFTVLPTILSLSPTSGPVGASVTISGYNFGSSGSVTFNNQTATTTSWNSTTIIATVPSTATTGNVVVTSNSASSVGVPFTVVPTPNISSISVNHGIAGTPVTISGTNFGSGQGSEAGLAVFNGANAFITSWSSTSIVALVPSTAFPGAGTVSVTVGGVQSNTVAFTVNPNITSMSPGAGPVGQAVLIAGADFGSTQGTVKFGTLTAVVNSWNSTTISAVVPNSVVGTISITVTAGSVTTNGLWFTVTGASNTAPVAAPPVPGMPPFASFGGGPVDTIDLGNLNVHFDLPVYSRAGRGTPFNYTLKYDTSVWYPGGAPGAVKWQPVSNWGWAGQSSVVFGSLTYLVPVSGTCTADGKPYTIYYGWSYQDKFGVSHPLNISGLSNDPNCGTNTQAGVATDGSGYSVSITAVPNTVPQAFTSTVSSVAGRQLNPPVNSTAGAATFTDPNGNVISATTGGVFTDTLGTTALTVTGGAPNPLKFGYTPPAPAGGTVFVTVTYKNYSVLTNFGCTGISEYSNSSVPLVDKVTYPDGTFYQFAYEATPGSSSNVTGRLTSVTLPTGGTLTYTYAGGSNGIICADGSTAGFKRYTPDTGGSAFWNYSRTFGSGAASTTTITDPTSQANVTAIQFQGIYETERQIYKGAVSQSNLLRTITTCYNGNTSNCPSTAIGQPVLQRNVTNQLPGTNNLTALQVYRYNSNQNILEKDEYDYGSGTHGALIRKTLTSYATLGNNINNKPSLITVEDGSNNIKSQTAYTYDEGSVTATSGTPQHVSVIGSRGNLTTISFLVGGSTTLNRTFTYYDTGTVLTVTDVNNAQYTNTYGSGSCGNSFPTSISEPLTLSRSITWNCVGGVVTSATDENNKNVSVAYTTDPSFWRPNSWTDQNANVTSLRYTGQTSSESSMLFNGTNSTRDILSTVDGLGRPHIIQQKEGPSSTTYDSMETDYDVYGDVDRTTLSYPGTAGQASASAPSLNKIFDPLGRKTQSTDSGGRITAFTYTQNDTYRSLGPAPNGENAKRSNYEYDGLGRMTSVCEVTTLPGNGMCGQTSLYTGYLTKYSYDTNNNLTGVTQNAQSASSQSRTYVYDGLNRMISESNPETSNATTTYTYDADSTCGTSKGDVVKKVDPEGDTTCYAYDALHRMTSTIYSGPFQPNTPNKYFVYDAATVNGVALVNVRSRQAEAYTATCVTCTKITDVGFSYTARGEVSDVYQSTPHSGAYYHVTQTYWANGVPEQLSGLPGLPAITNGVDGEGRLSTTSASTGQNPLTNTAYNTASLATAVTFGSSDNDSFNYDPNTDRMTQYKFNVNGQSAVGNLTWNPIGTLAGLSVNDAFDNANNQTCSYNHDDLSRLASVDCGSVWAQRFSYDEFGNIQKSGSSPFNPTYSSSTNHMTQIGSSTPTYDLNGDVTNDFLHSYAWDANGRPVTIDTVGVTYDALGRMVEQNRSGSFTEIVYAPSGAKLALMTGTTLQKGYVPLSGGTMAVYNSSGLAYYRHADWVGSSRLASTPSRTIYFDGAYAPFGEAYATIGTLDLSFTGMNQDTVANLYDFPGREYGIQGRWPSPDPAGLSAAFLKDPQTLNRYAYVRNSPLHLIDPEGYCPAQPGPTAAQSCTQAAQTKASDAFAHLEWQGVKTQLTEVAQGTLTGIVTGCIWTIEVGCWEGVAAGAFTGFVGGLIKGTGESAVQGYQGVKQIQQQLQSDLAACKQ